MTLEPLDGYLPPPYVPPSTLDERLVAAWREVTRTPGRAALAVVDLCAVAGFAISLRTIPVSTADATGPLHARCGVTFYVTGASNRAVDAACRYQFASRVPELMFFAAVVVVASLLLIRSIARPAASGLWQAVTRTPGRAALVTFDVAALVAVVAAAQPVSLNTSDAAGALHARCGVQYFLFGAPNAAVGDACRSAYAARASVFFLMLAALAVGGAALVRLLLADAQRDAVADRLVDVAPVLEDA